MDVQNARVPTQCDHGGRVIFRRQPRILFIAATDGEDYGVQGLYDGLCDYLRAENVVEWPTCPFHHWPLWTQRTYDSQCNWPEVLYRESDVRAMLIAGQIDYVFVSSGRQPAASAALCLAPWFDHSRYGVMLFDLEDHGHMDAIDPYFSVPQIDRNVRLVFKREVSLGTKLECPVPISPIPFGYPRSRAYPPHLKRPDAKLVFFHANGWHWEDDQSIRGPLVRALKSRFGDQADVGISECSNGNWDGRMMPDEYMDRLRACRIGISVRGAGSDTNRYWETPAAGCVLVSDRPTHLIPDNFIQGKEAFFYDTVDEAIAIIEDLQANPAKLAAVAQAGYEKWMERHTTLARARFVLRQTALWHVARHSCLPDWCEEV